MKRYGQTLTWGPLSAPALFTGEVSSYNYDPQVQEQEIEGAESDYIAMVLHSKKAALSFDAKVTSGSTDFLDLTDAAAGIAVDTTETATGTVLVYEAVERWQLMQPKTCSIRATHYPDMVLGEGALAAATLSAFTPTQTGIGIVFPGAGIIYSTFGLTHASGVVHALTLTQSLKIIEDEPTPDGKIIGAATAGYMRKISLDLLATGALPAVESVLVVTGAPAHAGSYRITRSGLKKEMAKGMMYGIEASWIPPFSA